MIENTISNIQIASMYIALTLTFILPLLAILFFFFRKKLNGWAFFIGFGLSIITQMLITPGLALGAAAFGLNEMGYMLIAGLCGGALEELVRFMVMKSMKKNRKVKDAISLGLGQAITITLGVGVVLISYVMSAKAIQNGTIVDMYESSEAASEIVKVLVATPWYYYLMSAFDCLMNVGLYMAYSIMILFAIRKGERRYLFNTMIIHASIISMGALLSTVSIAFKEVYTLICLCLAIYIALPMYKEMKTVDIEQALLAEKLALEQKVTTE